MHAKGNQKAPLVFTESMSLLLHEMNALTLFMPKPSKSVKSLLSQNGLNAQLEQCSTHKQRLGC